MGIFQTIWTALTTENELLTTLLLFPETYLESTINMMIFLILLNVCSNKKSKLNYIFIFGTSTNVSNIFIPNPYRSFFNLLALIISIKIFFKTNLLKTILATIIPILFTVLCESIITKTLSSLIDFNSIVLISVPIYRLGVTLAIQLLMYLIYLLIKYTKFQISIFENMSRKSKHIFSTNLVFAIIAISIQFLVTGFYLDKLPIYIVFLINISLISYFLLSIYSLTKTSQLEITSLDLAQEKEHNKILKSLQDDLHGFRHDFSNIICTMGGYVQVSDMDGLKKYYSQIQKDINKVNNLGSLNPETINNPAVYALISSKYNDALELGIEMNINVFINLNKLNMKIYEFTRILGILLDNSIQASKECEIKIINIEIRKDSNRNRQILLIENTYTDTNIDLDKIFNKNFSTKPKNSGLGLWEVRQILKKNENLNLYTTKDNKFFKQQLEMYNI